MGSLDINTSSVGILSYRWMPASLVWRQKVTGLALPAITLRSPPLYKILTGICRDDSCGTAPGISRGKYLPLGSSLLLQPQCPATILSCLVNWQRQPDLPNGKYSTSSQNEALCMETLSRGLRPIAPWMSSGLLRLVFCSEPFLKLQPRFWV